MLRLVLPQVPPNPAQHLPKIPFRPNMSVMIELESLTVNLIDEEKPKEDAG
jgi:hypothetical protein